MCLESHFSLPLGGGGPSGGELKYFREKKRIKILYLEKVFLIFVLRIRVGTINEGEGGKNEKG